MFTPCNRQESPLFGIRKSISPRNRRGGGRVSHGVQRLLLHMDRNVDITDGGRRNRSGLGRSRRSRSSNRTTLRRRTHHPRRRRISHANQLQRYSPPNRRVLTL